jgi:flagellar basal body-associated protein FliL
VAPDRRRGEQIVAEEKKKEADAGGGKKKGLPAFVLVAAGAVLGGAGVVFAVPPKVKEVRVEAPHYEDVDVTHPDSIKKSFNPRTRTGKGQARVEFKLVYTVREDRRGDAFELIRANWDQAQSNALMLLKNRSMEELQSDLGMRQLEKDLIEELDRTLFPNRPEKLARVTRVLWGDLLFQ